MGGGSTKQKTNSSTVNKPPKWFNDAAIKSLQVADRINQAGYVPYMGNQVAAFTPMQQAGMQGVSDWASAANGTAPMDAMAGMPQAKVDGSGVAGYESATGMMRNLELIKERFPKQYDLMTQFGGDLLANPSLPPRDIKDSPWNVGDEAKKAWDRENAGGGGAGGDPFNMSALLTEGLKDGPGGAMMAFMGLPYMSRGTGSDTTAHGSGSGPPRMTSAYQRLFDQNVLWGRNPWSQPMAPAAPPPQIEQPPLPPYTPPNKWW